MAHSEKAEIQAPMSSKSAGAKRTSIAEDPVAVISLLSKTVAKLDNEPFKAGGISLAEWTGLRTMATSPQAPTGVIARKLGFSRQRGAQIVHSLQQAGLITISRSPFDSRKKDLAITSAGRAKLQQMDNAIDAMLKEAFKSRPKALSHLAIAMNALLKVMSTEAKEPSE